MLKNLLKKPWFRSIIWAVLIAIIWFNVIHIRRCRGVSMLPTIHSGAIVLVYELGVHRSAPERGDIVYMRSNERPIEILCKRVVALPGETIEFRQGAVHVVGEKLDEPYIISNRSWNMPPLTLDDHHVYVVGDNRGMAQYLHTQGPADIANIVGRVVYAHEPKQNYSYSGGSTR